MTATGTFDCLICGLDFPHAHADTVIDAWRDDQIRRDGWTSLLVREPKALNGWYLCRGHKLEGVGVVEIVRNQRRAPFLDMPAEVLWFARSYGFYVPLAFGTRSGGDAFVKVVPTHWRELPAFLGQEAKR